MPHVTLYAPDVTCDHCIASIREAVETVEGARFVSGDPDAKSFVVDIASGAVLDAVGAATAEAGYPLGEAPSPAAADDPHAGGTPAGWTPAYRVERTDIGANVNYDCPCGCDAGIAYDRSRADQEPGSCCCGKLVLVGPGAEQRLRSTLNGGAYRVDVQQITMPWGQPVETALAIPE